MTLREETFYLSSPVTQQQLQAAAGMPVLFSYALFPKHAWKGYLQSFARVLIDSGAFSVMNSGKRVDVAAYAEWSRPWIEEADAIAGLDDIEGDWRKSLKNYEAQPWAFPTFHDSDPAELLEDLVAMARERSGWIGVGVVPPRHGKAAWITETLNRIPADLHVHGWALGAYSGLRAFRQRASVSFDSTNWWQDAMAIRTLPDCAHLHYGECLDIVVKRYQREARLKTVETATESQEVMW